MTGRCKNNALVQKTGLTKRGGFSLLELVIIIAVVGIVLGIGVVSLKGLQDPLGDSAEQLEGTFKQVRAKAMATTSAYRVRPGSVVEAKQQLIVDRAKSCNGTGGWQVDDIENLSLAKDVTLGGSSWTVCFNSRGMATATGNTAVVLTYETEMKTVEVYTGGGVRIQ